MPHRNPFKPMPDHPSLDEVMKAPPACPHCHDSRDCSSVGICNALHEIYAADPVSPIHRHPSNGGSHVQKID